jgi:hypothetical protein
MEWSDERRDGRESEEGMRFPSLYQIKMTSRDPRMLVVGQIPVRALLRQLVALRRVRAAASLWNRCYFAVGPKGFRAVKSP